MSYDCGYVYDTFFWLIILQLMVMDKYVMSFLFFPFFPLFLFWYVMHMPSPMLGLVLLHRITLYLYLHLTAL